MKGRIYPNKSGYVVRFGRSISKWFKDRAEAERFLTGLRYETDKGTFDIRDYQKDKPLSFSNLADQYSQVKKQDLKPRSFNNIKNYINRAKIAWGHANIKAIGYAEIEDFLYSQNVSNKTRSNMRSCLHNFWVWLRKRRTIMQQEFPEFPEISYELGGRKIVDQKTQRRIIDEVYRISKDVNIKIWIGIKWLSVYIGMRPGEMLNLKEENIDLGIGALIIPHPKEKRPKLIYLLDEDIEFLKKMPRGLPQLPFFRHSNGVKGATAGSSFGQRYLWKWWKKACDNLGIEGVDLYGGTRHSTTTALSQHLTPEEIKTGTLHSTNKAFERYFQREAKDAKKVYQTIQDIQDQLSQNNENEMGRVIKLKNTFD